MYILKVLYHGFCYKYVKQAVTHPRSHMEEPRCEAGSLVFTANKKNMKDWTWNCTFVSIGQLASQKCWNIKQWLSGPKRRIRGFSQDLPKCLQHKIQSHVNKDPKYHKNWECCTVSILIQKDTIQILNCHNCNQYLKGHKSLELSMSMWFQKNYF